MRLFTPKLSWCDVVQISSSLSKGIIYCKVFENCCSVLRAKQKCFAIHGLAGHHASLADADRDKTVVIVGSADSRGDDLGRQPPTLNCSLELLWEVGHGDARR
jgi:hypothetical protein